VGCAATIFGDEGKIHVPDAWLPGGKRQGTVTELVLQKGEDAPVKHEITALPVYAIEAERMLSSLPNLEPTWPAMGWADTLGNLSAMNAWRTAVWG
jgi:hypothetical protein